MAASSPPAPGAASRGTRKHSRSRSASWSGSSALGGGDGLDPAHGGPLSPFAQEHQDRAGVGAGEVVQPGLPGGDGDGQVEGGPGLAGLLLGGQDPVGVGRPQALDEPAGLAGRGDPGRDLPVGADGQLGRGQGRAAGPAGAGRRVTTSPPAASSSGPVGRGMPSRSWWSLVTPHRPAAGGAWPPHRAARTRWWPGPWPRGCRPPGRRPAAPPAPGRRPGARRRRAGRG